MRFLFYVFLLAGSIAGCTHEPGGELRRVKDLDSGNGYTAYLVAYWNDGLELHALVAVPRSEMPAAGYPVVIANHGYVRDPLNYGMSAEGRESRPGDYYRPVPELYTLRGFLVVMPDYRGHNSSQGYEQIAERNFESVGLYAEDVVALMSRLDSLDEADVSNVFMWSHSMGGAVSLRALLATDFVKASSFWSTVDVSDVPLSHGDLSGPVIVHHATGDQTTSHASSEDLVNALRESGHQAVFHSYDSDDHFFDTQMAEIAADRDNEFFRGALSPP